MTSTPPCPQHPQEPAVWICEKCEQSSCSICLEQTRDLVDPISTRCPSCRGRCYRRDDPKGASVSTFQSGFVPDLVRGGAANYVESMARISSSRQPWNDQLLSAFSYPLRGENWWFLLVAVLFFWLVDWLQSYALIFRAAIAIFFAGYFCSYLVKILRLSAHGDFDLPDWPDFYQDEIFKHLAIFCVAALLTLVPGYLIESYGHHPILGTAILYIGVFFFPMTLLAAVIHNHPLAANPVLVTPALLKTWKPYLSVVIACLCAVFLFRITTWIGAHLGMFGVLLIRYAQFYTSVVCMHMLGLFYFRHKQQFPWFT